MRTVFARVEERCDLPPLPAVSAQALRLLREPTATAEDMARLIGTDAAMAARVLHLSRSPMYLRRVPPTNLRDAILTVGFAGLRQILLAASVRSIFKIDKAAAQRLWDHALCVALAAEELRKVDGVRGGGDSFLAGLMHDVGRQVFFLANPVAAADIAADDLVGEEREFGVTHTAVAGCLAQRWGLDDEVVAALIAHHDEDAQGLARRIAKGDMIADALGHPLVAPSASDAAEPAPLDPSLQECADRVAEELELHKSLFS